MKLLFSGGGNMASAIISGLSTKKHNIYVIDPSPLARKKILRLGKNNSNRSVIEVFSNIQDFLKKNIKPSWLLLGVKPQQINSVYQEIRRVKVDWISTTPILSIVAGLNIKTLQVLTKNKNIFRAMPNTPAIIRMGITGYFCTKNLSLKLEKDAVRFLSQVGEVVKLPNEQCIDVVTAISGSGPGYTFKFISALEMAALNVGLPKSFINKFIFSTLNGSLQLWNQGQESSKDLISKVASKGGTTEEALNYLDDYGFDGLIINAVEKAKNKSRSLSLETNKQVQKHAKK